MHALQIFGDGSQVCLTSTEGDPSLQAAQRGVKGVTQKLRSSLRNHWQPSCFEGAYHCRRAPSCRLFVPTLTLRSTQRLTYSFCYPLRTFVVLEGSATLSNPEHLRRRRFGQYDVADERESTVWSAVRYFIRPTILNYSTPEICAQVQRRGRNASLFPASSLDQCVRSL